MDQACKNCATRGQAKSQQEILDELADMIKNRRKSNGPIKNSSGVKPTPVANPANPYGVPTPANPGPRPKKKGTEWKRVKKTRKTSNVSHMDADGTLVYEEEEYWDMEQVEVDDEQIFKDAPYVFETIWG